MRVTVSVILKLLAEGKSDTDVIQCYPELEPADIHQAIQYAAWLAAERSPTDSSQSSPAIGKSLPQAVPSP